MHQEVFDKAKEILEEIADLYRDRGEGKIAETQAIADKDRMISDLTAEVRRLKDLVIRKDLEIEQLKRR